MYSRPEPFRLSPWFFLVVLTLALIMILSGVSRAQTATYRKHGPAALNDLKATPGATGKMTEKQLCAASFHTGTVRNVTEGLKQKVCAAYGIRKYEIDHLISLELGGTNDQANLWPQPYFPKPGAKEKDVVENWMHRQVCSGKMTLPAAQHAISTDWYQIYLNVNDHN